MAGPWGNSPGRLRKTPRPCHCPGMMPSPTPEPNPREIAPRDERPAPSLPASGPVPLDGLVAYARAVLEGLAANRDLKSDDEGRPIYRLRTAGMTAECT